MRWKADLRAAANARGKGLYAYGCDTTGGRWEQHGMMDHETAIALFMFINSVYRGIPPAEAFAETEWPDAEKGSVT